MLDTLEQIRKRDQVECADTELSNAISQQSENLVGNIYQFVHETYLDFMKRYDPAESPFRLTWDAFESDLKDTNLVAAFTKLAFETFEQKATGGEFEFLVTLARAEYHAQNVRMMLELGRELFVNTMIGIGLLLRAKMKEDWNGDLTEVEEATAMIIRCAPQLNMMFKINSVVIAMALKKHVANGSLSQEDLWKLYHDISTVLRDEKTYVDSDFYQGSLEHLDGLDVEVPPIEARLAGICAMLTMDINYGTVSQETIRNVFRPLLERTQRLHEDSVEIEDSQEDKIDLSGIADFLNRKDS